VLTGNKVEMVTGTTAIDVVELDVTYRAVDAGSSVTHALPGLFSAAWPAYRNWFLQAGEAPLPSYATCVAQLRRHMPELVTSYEQLVDAVGGGDLEARFLSHWCPPPVFATCSLAAWTKREHVLVHNYDYSPLLCDTTVLASAWHGTAVMAMSDCGWGATDGINAHGLSVAIAFGGRPVVSEGFGIGLIVRYVLELAPDVPSALDILRRVPVRLAYNVALVDRSGNGVVAFVSPDRPLAVSDTSTAGNRQGSTEWPEHSTFCGTVEREEALARAVAEPAMTASGLLERFLAPPIYRDPATTLWGTVFTAAYDCDRGSVVFAWPGDSWTLSLDGFTEESHTRRSLVAVPSGAALAEPGAPARPAHGHPSFIM
jgi:predicted choloylglycine hydrolase